VARYYKLTVAPDSPAKVALAFDTGDPAIVEEPIARGRSILVATSADTAWSAMPLWPSFPPIVHELLSLAVGGQSAERNLMVGQPLGDVFEGSGARGEVQISTPAKERAAARITSDGAETSWTFADTTQSGIYEARLPSVGKADEFFAVNVDTSESDLTRLDVDELRQRVWSGVPFVHRTDWQDLSNEPSESVVRRQWLHVYLLSAAFALLVLETVLASYFGRRAA
jgi:hypothetical protein